MADKFDPYHQWLAIPASEQPPNHYRLSSKKVKKAAWVPEAEAGTVPRHGSRRWARANFHSGIISIEELNAFYVTHPEDLSDPDR